jgi:hypothetical protein
MHSKEAGAGRCGTSFKPADTARRANGPNPPGAGGGLRDPALASLVGHPARLRSAALSRLPGAPRDCAAYFFTDP